MNTMAEVLAEHQHWVDSKNLGYYRTEYTCMCGGTFWAGEHLEDPTYDIARAAHQAEMLAVAGFGDVRERDAALERVLAACDRIITNADGHKPPGPPHPTREQATAMRIRAAITATEES